MSFLSKMNNKKVIVSKIESNEDAAVIIIDDKVSTPKVSTHVPAVNAIVASSLTQTNTNSPLSPKRTPINNNTCNIAEKRGKCLYLKTKNHNNLKMNALSKFIGFQVCSGNDETTVKRLRLDQDASVGAITACQEVQTLSIVKKDGKKRLNFPAMSGTTEKATALISAPIVASVASPSTPPRTASTFFEKLIAKKKMDTINVEIVNSNNNKENEKAVDLVTIDD
jgi:hypothetical protein